MTEKDKVNARLFKLAAAKIKELSTTNEKLQKEATANNNIVVETLAKIANISVDKLHKLANNEASLINLCERIADRHTINSALANDGSYKSYEPNFRKSASNLKVESAADFAGLTYEDINKQFMEDLKNKNY